MSKDALKKFRPSSGKPNIKQRFKRVGYFAGGGEMTAGDMMDTSATMDTMVSKPVGVTPTPLPTGDELPPMTMMKRGGKVRGCGAAVKGKTKGRMV